MKKILLCVFILLVSVNVFASEADIEQLTEKAINGDAEAQYQLAINYSLEDEIDDTKIAYWLQKAAEQGHAMAQCGLGIAYELGRGVDQDNEQAVYWYQKAAEQGYVPAQNILGNCYFYGIGVPQDYKQAYMWIFIGLTQPTEIELKERYIARLKELEIKMTPAEIAEAEQMAVEWMERHR